MFCEKQPGERIESMASILILGGMIPLCAVILLQYIWKFEPCHFCMLQRYPYGPVIFAGGLSLLVKRGGGLWRLLVLIGLLGLLTTAGIGIYHTGIEQGWVHYTGGCVATAPADNSLESLRAAIKGAPLVSCADATAKFLGLSLATWNVLWALFVSVLVVLQYRFDRKQHG